MGILGELSFTENSSWIWSRKFRLGVKTTPRYSGGVRIREAKIQAFAVKDHRREWESTIALSPDFLSLNCAPLDHDTWKSVLRAS